MKPTAELCVARLLGFAAGCAHSIGRSRSPKAGTGVLSTVDELPFFLQANALKPFIDKALMESTKAEFYRSRTRNMRGDARRNQFWLSPQ